MDLTDLLKLLHSSEYVLQRFAQQLISELSSMVESDIEGFFELFESLPKLMKPSPDAFPPTLYKNSVLGLYIRRIIILFEQLPFSGVAKLFYNCFAELMKINPDTFMKNSSTPNIKESSSKK